jgi:F0F1-type ATP synthase epsilon subunit
MDLGNITITDGTVSLSGSITVTFDGDISENNCSGNAGTITVTAGDTDVIVQISTSTTIVDSNSNTLSCGDLSSGTVSVTGNLLMGNTVQANRIELQ